VYDLVLFGLFVVWLGVTSWLIMQAYTPVAEPVTTTQELPETPPAA